MKWIFDKISRKTWSRCGIIISRMIKIDEQFLEEVGLANMPEEEKKAFMAHAQEELEVRVGEKMAEGLTVAQLEEFDGIMNMDRNVMIRILARMGDYRKDELYARILKRHGVTEGTMEILSEFLSVKWIQEHRPDYAEVAEQVAQELKMEIMGSRAEIAGA